MNSQELNQALKSIQVGKVSESTIMMRCTIAMAVASWIGVGVAIWTVVEQRNDARELLRAQIGVELDKEFDSTEMRRARRTLASELLKSKPQISEWRVFDFFEKVGMYRRLDRIDTETVYSSFSYYVERYWPASQEYIREFRKKESDNDFYGDFEQLNADLLAIDASEKHRQVPEVTPTLAEIKEFLREEASLSQ